MSQHSNRREFLAQVGVAAAGAVVLPSFAFGGQGEPASRVVMARDAKLIGGEVGEHAELLRKLLDASVQKLTGAPDAAAAWRKWFTPKDRVGIKVNTLGFSTQPAVVDAIVAGLRQADVPAENIVIWDRFDAELARGGYKLNKSTTGVRCYGTDSERVGSGYQERVETSGQIGSCFSRILAEQVDAIISVPVLKDHNLAGVSLSMKNFFGAIHNPNKYHGTNCDPYISDVVAHPFIARKWRLTVLDATRGQYQGGPGRNPDAIWPYGALVVSTDFVAVDAVGADIVEAKRKAVGLPPLADDKRPTTHIATAAQRKMGVADLGRIERIEV